MHLSAGPTEALFEIDNFLKSPFGIDFITSEAHLAKRLMDEGLKESEIRRILTNKELHGELEHKDTEEAVNVIKNKFKFD